MMPVSNLGWQRLLSPTADPPEVNMLLVDDSHLQSDEDQFVPYGYP